MATVNTKLCRCAPKCPGAKQGFSFQHIFCCIQRLWLHSVYVGSCYLLGRRNIKAGGKEDLSILPVRKLQDLDEKAGVKSKQNIRTEQLERFGSSARVMRSVGKRAPLVLLPMSSSFTETLRLSREVG